SIGRRSHLAAECFSRLARACTRTIRFTDVAELMSFSTPFKQRSATMHETENSITPAAKRVPWNKGKLTGAKPPLRPKHVWAIRTKLQMERQTRDLALFNLAINSKLRGCDVVAVKLDDVAPNGYAVDRATVRQRETGRPVRFELTEQTRQ